MLISKFNKELDLVKKQLNEIEVTITDPIERITQKKLLERKIKKLEQSKSQIEALEQEQQELELLKSEFLINDNESINNQELEIIDSVNNESNITNDKSNLNEPIKNTQDNKPDSLHLKESSSPIYSSNSLNKSSTSWFNIKYLTIVGIIFTSVMATLLIINFNSTQKEEQARLQELAKQEVMRAKQEVEKARQEQAKAEREKREAIRAKEEAEQARQAAIQAKQEARQQLAASNRIERNSPSFTQQDTVNLNNRQEQIDNLADRTFYSRYPELRGRKIRNDETFLKQEWLKIRNCEATVDYIFYQKHPELGGRKILLGEKSLAQEWLQIKRNNSGCN